MTDSPVDRLRSLEELWAEVEAALPERWELHVWSSPTGSGWLHVSAVPPMGETRWGSRPRKVTAGGDRMPLADALRELLAELK